MVYNLNQTIKESSQSLLYMPTFPSKKEELWIPPPPRWWKINCDAAIGKGRAALAMVAHDDDGLLICASSILLTIITVFEA